MAGFVYPFDERLPLDGILLDAYFGGGATIESDNGEPRVAAIYLNGVQPLHRFYKPGALFSSRSPVKVWLDCPAGSPATFSEHLYVALRDAIEGSADLRDAWREHCEQEKSDAA